MELEGKNVIITGATSGIGEAIRKPAPAALDDRAAARLWELSREYTGI
jgi:NAD(P)-dependent dehydrogenase (short-subunit alcohol dehydrogenase family)